MDYSDLNPGDNLELKVNTHFTVLSNDSDLVTLIPSNSDNNSSDDKLYLRRTNNGWIIDDLDKLNVQFELLTPYLSEQCDITRDILIQINPTELTNICKSSKEFKSICEDPQFWKDRLRSRYGDEIEKLFQHRLIDPILKVSY